MSFDNLSNPEFTNETIFAIEQGVIVVTGGMKPEEELDSAVTEVESSEPMSDNPDIEYVVRQAVLAATGGVRPPVD